MQPLPELVASRVFLSLPPQWLHSRGGPLKAGAWTAVLAAIGWPHFGQEAAASETWAAHTGQLMSGMARR